MVINTEQVILETIKISQITNQIDEICKQYTPYNEPRFYNMLKQILINGCLNQIQWYSAMRCTFIDHTIKEKEVDLDEH